MVAAQEVVLDQTTLTLTIGKSEQLTAEVRPSNTFDKTLSWGSEDAAIATVSADGLVSGVSEGTVTIKVNCGTAVGSCLVTVVDDSSVENFTSRVRVGLRRWGFILSPRPLTSPAVSTTRRWLGL
ncbi:MAG: Ig-like domain-containing protein [Bacteroidales bacterium]|nr:Ig-like domain-containing protein [Bacteroidales bacterium]